MPNLLQTGSDWLADQKKAWASKSVTYKRGVNQVVVQAEIGKTVFEADGGEGIIDRWESRDFLIHAADLVIATQVVLPQRGDQIVEVIGSTTVTYDVQAPRDVPVFQYDGVFRKRVRVHSQQAA
jgi:hypothetical protein